MAPFSKSKSELYSLKDRKSHFHTQILVQNQVLRAQNSLSEQITYDKIVSEHFGEPCETIFQYTLILPFANGSVGRGGGIDIGTGESVGFSKQSLINLFNANLLILPVGNSFNNLFNATLSILPVEKQLINLLATWPNLPVQTIAKVR